jgi:chlorite dismutase
VDEGDDDMTDLHGNALHCIDVIDKKFDTSVLLLARIDQSIDRSFDHTCVPLHKGIEIESRNKAQYIYIYPFTRFYIFETTDWFLLS